jgi:hypothetical protein
MLEDSDRTSLSTVAASSGFPKNTAAACASLLPRSDARDQSQISEMIAGGSFSGSTPSAAKALRAWQIRYLCF